MTKDNLASRWGTVFWSMELAERAAAVAFVNQNRSTGRCWISDHGAQASEASSDTARRVRVPA